MAASQFHAGQHGKFKVVGTPDVDLPTSKWDVEINSNNKKVFNSRDGVKRVPGLSDFSGSFNLPYDSANDPTLAANGGLKEGSIIVFKGFIDDTHFYLLPSIVDSIGAASEIEGEIMFPVKFSQESGTYTAPTYP